MITPERAAAASGSLTCSGEHTHDFESGYLDGLVRPADRERVSPLQHAKSIVAAVAARGLWHRVLIFEGEGHGFRKAGSVTASLNAELDLYSYAMHIDRSLLG